MPRPVELTLSRLESREVPAAGLFADLRPGVWGSNPQLQGASGDTLYFSANDIYHGPNCGRPTAPKPVRTW